MPFSPMSQDILDFVSASGDRCTMEALIDHVAPAIPPGLALRTYQRISPRVRYTEEYGIYAGQRAMIQLRVSKLFRYLDVIREDGKRWVVSTNRLSPDV